MANEKKEIHQEMLLELEEAAAYLEAIAKGLRQGDIAFRSHETEVQSFPTGGAGLELKLKQEKTKSKLTFRLSWREGESLDEITHRQQDKIKKASAR